MIKSVTFKNVRVGDRIFDTHYFGHDKWRDVTNISNIDDDLICLALGANTHPIFDTRTKVCGHPEDSIAVIQKEDQGLFVGELEKSYTELQIEADMSHDWEHLLNNV